MQQSATGLHLPEKRRAWIGCENVEGGALQPGIFDPLHGASKDIGPVVVEAQHEAAVDLNAIVVQ